MFVYDLEKCGTLFGEFQQASENLRSASEKLKEYQKAGINQPQLRQVLESAFLQANQRVNDLFLQLQQFRING